MNITRLHSLIRKLIFVFLFLLYGIGEVLDSYYPNLVHSIIENTTRIDPFNMTNITGYVYFSLTGTSYPTLYDEFLNITVYGAVIKRKVEYCQYEQTKSSSRIGTYKNIWTSNYINSSNFLDKNYINPPLSVVVNQTAHYNNVTVGNLTILSSFYTDDLNFYYFDLNEDGVDSFTYSNASSEFEYIKRGYFYHSVTNKSALSRLEKIQDQLLKDEVKYDNILYEMHLEMFKKCHSGDVRVRYILYAPQNVTYFGYVENYTLKSVFIDDTRFGATQRGSRQKLRTLVKAFTPNGIYYQQDSMEEFFTISYLYIVKMKIAIDICRFVSHFFRNDPLRLSYWLITVSLANLVFRSFIWSSWQLDVRIWAAFLVAVLIVGLVLGIWRIQFTNQRIDIHVHFDRDMLENVQRILNNIGNDQIHIRINRANINDHNRNNQDANNLNRDSPNTNDLHTNNQATTNLNTNNQNTNNLNMYNQNTNEINENNHQINELHTTNLNTNNLFM